MEAELRELERQVNAGEPVLARLHRARARAGVANTCPTCGRRIRRGPRRPRGRISCTRPSRSWCWGQHPCEEGHQASRDLYWSVFGEELGYCRRCKQLFVAKPNEAPMPSAVGLYVDGEATQLCWHDGSDT